MKEQIAKYILGQLRELPVLPEVVIKLINELEKSSVDYHKLQKIIRLDPVLTSRLLRIANSSFFGLSRRVNSVQEACLVLGASSIRHLVMATSVIEQFPAHEGNVIDRKSLWKHALGTAVTSKHIAEIVDVEPEQAFTAGLLHDFGKLAMDAYFYDYYSEITEFVRDRKCLLSEAEREIVGTDHREVGQALALHWYFPTQLVKTIGEYGEPSRENPHTLSDVVHVADIICQALGVGDSGNGRIPVLSEHVWQRLGIEWEDVGRMLPEIERSVEEDIFVIS